MFLGEGRSMRRAHSVLRAGSGCPELGYGRFMQADPLGYGDGMNMYAYAGGDPVNGIDPSGLANETKVEAPHIYCTDDCTGSRISGNVSASNFGFTGTSNTSGSGASYGGNGVAGTSAGSVGAASAGSSHTVNTYYTPPGGTEYLVSSVTYGALHLNGGVSGSSVAEEDGDITVNGRRWRAGSNSGPRLAPGDLEQLRKSFNPKTNYCGGSGGTSLPNSVGGGGYNEACFAHDNCYASSGTPKSQCDSNFAFSVAILNYGRQGRWLGGRYPLNAVVLGFSAWAIVHFGGGKYYAPK